MESTAARAVSGTFMPQPAPRPCGAQQRVFLDVTLQSDCHGKPDTPRERLNQLLHSALGVYIVGTTVAGEDLVVRFDIAATDVDFTLHMLITALPDALIGRLLSRGV